jgi:hypothetical protein
MAANGSKAAAAFLKCLKYQAKLANGNILIIIGSYLNNNL